MRSPALVALTAACSAAIAAPLAIGVHDGSLSAFDAGSVTRQLRSQLDAASARSTTDSGSSSTDTDQGGASTPQTAPDGSSTSPSNGGAQASGASSSGTTTRATAAQSKGVVMIDVATPSGEAAGSGMVLTADGTVLTNYHVVSGSTQIRVTVPNGGAHTASVVGHDESHDVAVLKLSGAKNLDTVTLDTDGVRTAEEVLAVGQGGGEGVLYAASGIVTATGRSITASEQGSLSSGENLTNLVQTNAPIVGGYSGGPLFDAAGKVVGIDTAASATNSLTGYQRSNAEGYAIPITQAKSIADDILAGRKTTTNHIGAKAALGVAVVPSSSLRGASDTGVVVQQVLNGSAVASTGMTAGDTITALDGKAVTSTDSLSSLMGTRYPGSTIKVTWSDTSGASHTASVTLQKSTAN